MISINEFLSVSDQSAFPLAHYDHLWMIENLNKAPGSALLRPSVLGILANYMPRSFAIKREPKGRPYALSVEGPCAAFSFSHSERMAFLLISKEEPVGVDGEIMRPRRHQDAIAERYFGIKKRLSLEQFYQEWTAREAYIKAAGLTLFEAPRCLKFSEHKIGTKERFLRLDSARINEHYMLSYCRSLTTKRPVIYFRDSDAP